ncbi:MAG: hypothetical protein JW943_07820 [Deltaproteobacteria bacterium]|nr:hypothetical protein [Deltaproteobacteria bacterium]
MITNQNEKAIQKELFPKPSIKYAYRLETRKVKEPDFPYLKSQMSGTKDVLNFVRTLEDSDIEKMIVLYLNAQNELICISITPGSINSAVVYPREIVKNAILSQASAIIMVHNHPSGHNKPSDHDIHLTDTIRKAMKLIDVLVHDHVIVSETGFFSMREEGMLS